MLVHGPRAFQHPLEHVPAQGYRHRKADRRPQRIAATDPVAETEGPAAAPGLGLLRRRRHPDQMFAHAARRQAFGQPGLGQIGVGQGLLGGEGLGHHHHQRGLRVQSGQGLAHVARIDVGDEAQVDGRLQRPQGVPQQSRPEVRAADADVDDGGERLLGPAGLGARADVGGELRHPGAGRRHLFRDRLPQRPEIGVVGGAQGRMQHRPALGVVDRLAAEQGGPPSLDVAGPGQIQRGLEPLRGPALFGQVQIEAGRLDPHALGAPLIGGELMEDARPGVLARHGAKHVQGLVAGGHGRTLREEGKPSFTGGA